MSTDKGNTITGSFADYDNDGDVDLFAPDMGSNNYFYTNNSDGTFSSLSKGEIVEDTTVSLSAAWADYDNDGDLDIFATNGVIEQIDMLYRNNGDGTFNRIFDSPLVENSASAWNGAWGDFDNDGDLDFITADCASTRNLYYEIREIQIIG